MTNTDTPTPSFRRFRVGSAVLWRGRAYAVVESREDGHMLELVGKRPARVFADADTVLTPAP